MKLMRPVFPGRVGDVSHPLLSTFLSAWRYTGTSGTFSHLILSSAHWGRCHCRPCLFYWHFPTLCFQLPLIWVSSWPGLMELNGIWETSVIFTWFISYSCPVPLLPNHCKVNLLLHNRRFSRSCQFMSLFTTCVYSFLHASTIYLVPLLGQTLLHFGVTKSWPSRHFCSSREKDVCWDNCSFICAVPEGNVGCC